LRVILPSGFTLSDGLVYPKNYEIESDGKSIILKWDSVDEEVIIFYEGPRDFSYIYLTTIFSIILASILFWNFS